jgi:hypothetical protein
MPEIHHHAVAQAAVGARRDRRSRGGLAIAGVLDLVHHLGRREDLARREHGGAGVEPRRLAEGRLRELPREMPEIAREDEAAEEQQDRDGEPRDHQPLARGGHLGKLAAGLDVCVLWLHGLLLPRRRGVKFLKVPPLAPGRGKLCASRCRH